ncbi:RAD50-interacting protein 1 [Hyposmocoma kahamanoa]|uniref:RAD50-interacting protein 1 n=1 Tax=Hyposmocoma kahamanoa TaxID=1477025 RepID=UPI000E6DA06C|nr:RAD50-interacting protein 1 [Hyposmocoma kahamanoa]
MNEDDRESILHDLNIKIGSDINDLSNAYELENKLVAKRNEIQSQLNEANDEVPTKLSTAIKKAELNSKQIESLKERREKLKVKVDLFLSKTVPLQNELNKRFAAINKLEEVLSYLKSFEKIEDISNQLQQCSDDEQAVLLYGELKDMCSQYETGHRAVYIKEYTHYWHNVLKDKLTKNYDEVLKLLKWPITSGAENSPPPKEILLKFSNITKYLFLIQEPEDLVSVNVTNDFNQDQDPCLPVRILLRPLKKRFTFHFTGSRQTARLDRPEWFLTQTLTWIKDHQGFVRSHIQPVADKLQMKKVRAVDEFNAGLIALAAERLHTVLALYNTQGSKGEIVDSAFAHAVDETLGFHKELVAVTGKDVNSVLSVLTKAETFVRWLSVEKKYALLKMDETLGSEQWSEAVAAGVGSAVGSVVWVPRGADWFIALLKTIEERYAVLPQPGHRLQFLELQLELIEEWRVRLTQLMNAALGVMAADSLLTSDSPRHLLAVINAAHHTRTVLLQWAHSLHYLQLHYYRRQFHHFTQQQHHDVSESETDSSDSDDDSKTTDSKKDDLMSLNEVEQQAKTMAEREVTRRDSLMIDLNNYSDVAAPIANLSVTDKLPGDDEAEEAGVFAEAPALLAHLRDAGLAALADRILLEFKASIRDYKKQSWHAMLMVEQIALSVSAPLCRPLSALVGRMSRAGDCLAPALAMRLRAHLANALDQYIFEEVVLENWFNTGGTVQFTHDVKRNLVPAFAPPNKSASQINQLPKLVEACKLLNLDYDDARRLRSFLTKQTATCAETLANQGIRHILPHEALRVLQQRTDLRDTASPASVMELF